MPDILRVMVSSTARDLPEHRAMVRDACLAKDYFPDRMEEWPVADVDAVTRSMALVERAHVYVCLIGRRYGTVPKPGKVSITEMEFERALARGLPILVFTMDPLHPLIAEQVEASQTAQRRLKRFAQRACAGRLRGVFASPLELKTQVMDALDYLTLERVRAQTQALITTVLAQSTSDAQQHDRMRLQASELQRLQARLGAAH